MSVAEIDWGILKNLSGAALKHAVFAVLQEAALAIQSTDVDDPALLGVVPRLAQLIEARRDLAGYKEAFSSLARSVGLWNYIDREAADARDELAAEVARIPALQIVLHREQMAALNVLLSGQNLILSAPTSFGKSILVDALLLDRRYRRVAIVLPTIALLDEFRRRLMASITIRNVPDDVHRALRVRAARHGRSAEAEIREILEQAVKPPKRVRLGDALAALGRKVGLTDEDIAVIDQMRSKSPAEPMKFE